jgi:hypothetical protein
MLTGVEMDAARVRRPSSAWARTKLPQCRGDSSISNFESPPDCATFEFDAERVRHQYGPLV